MKTLILVVLLVGICQAALIRNKRQAAVYPRHQYQGGGGGYQPQQYQQQQYAPQGGQRARAAPGYGEPEEQEQGPHPLTQLLEHSKFSCGGKKDGYFADNTVNCQAYHQCVGGAKHSFMCPAGTVFHQVHLNCVPSSDDICKQADKFFFVNDYLHKPQKGPNNTVVWGQRYYPEGWTLGNPLVAPQQSQGGQGYGGASQGYGGASQGYGGAAAQGYGAAAPSYSPQPAPQAYAPPAQSAPAYQPAAPSRPAYHPPPQQAYQPPPSFAAPRADAYKPPSSNHFPQIPQIDFSKIKFPEPPREAAPQEQYAGAAPQGRPQGPAAGGYGYGAPPQGSPYGAGAPPGYGRGY